MAVLAFLTTRQTHPYVGSLAHGRNVVGRDVGCDIVLRSEKVSRRHCLVDVAPDQIWVTDVSRHGTWLNGDRLPPSVRSPIAFGDVLAVGPFHGELQARDGAPAPTADFDPASLPGQGAYQFGALVGRSRSMQQVFEALRRAASHDHPVAITGESGTGKELAARAIHDNGHRSGGPWVVLNCAGLTATLFESELFGHQEGAFTGAVRRTDGAFRDADGGTLFLDELGELPLSLQPKLLRALESGEVRRVGATEPDFTNVRLVTATNRDLKEMVDAGTFREDLYFRIAKVRIEMPPLRIRPKDISPTARALLDEVAPHRALTRNAKRCLMEYTWPGNVRQLRSVLQVAAAETPPHQPISEAAVARHMDPVVDRGMDPVVLRALYHETTSIRATAEALKVPYATMRRRLIKFGIVVPKNGSSTS